MQLAIHKATNDLFKPVGGGTLRVDDGRFTVQLCSNKLKTILGEWILDREAGFMNLGDLKKNYDLFDIESRLIQEVMSVEGVLRIYDIEIKLLPSRLLEINFKAITKYGEIDTKVPWDNGIIEVIEEEAPDLHAAVTFPHPVTGLPMDVTEGGDTDINGDLILDANGQVVNGIVVTHPIPQ